MPFIGEVDFDPSKIFEEAGKRRRALLDRGAHAPSAVALLQSHYYQFHDLLGQITGRKPPDVAARRQRFGRWLGATPPPARPRLNLLFLIDDLDRCLPDRAVEMIESIKLFLETEGCTFVLALDDEVIQRGIAFRYRHYIEDLGGEAPGTGGPAPITGTEYLEKIVQLPIFLPVPSQAGRRNVGFLARMEAWARDSQAGTSEGSWLTHRWLDAKIESYRHALQSQATAENANRAQEAQTWLPMLDAGSDSRQHPRPSRAAPARSR